MMCVYCMDEKKTLGMKRTQKARTRKEDYGIEKEKELPVF